MKLVFKFIKPYWPLCIGAAAAVMLDVAGALIVPTLTADMINIGVVEKNTALIISNGLQMLVVSVVTGASALLGSWLCARLAARVGRDMRNAVYQKSLDFSASDFERFGAASMVTRTMNDVNFLQMAVVASIQMVLPVPVMCALGVAFSFRIHKDMGFLLLGVMLLVLIVTTFIVKNAAPVMEKLQRFLDKMNVVLRENITGMRVIRAFNKERHETERMDDVFASYAKYAIGANRLFAALDSLCTLAINLCIVAVLYLGGNAVGRGEMLIGDISAVTEYTIWALFYLVMAQMVIVMLPRAIVCARRISEILALTPEIRDGELSALPDADEKELVRFENVSFRFADADEDTLSAISFVCRRGETTAIIGGTGSGKSTVAKLLLRFHDVTNGQIRFGGEDLRNLSQAALREHTAYVPQKAWLFSGTVAENLRYGRQDADDAALYHALDVAQADFVRALPDGLNARVAQGGTNFSGGQKQRLAIARALVKPADLYIFDDSFSALDFKTDAALRRALAGELENAAVLIIAQRVSTIVGADNIVVLDDGRIAGIGRHEELLKTCPLYRDIVSSQMKGGAVNE